MKKILLLFDVDGTLSPSRQRMGPEMKTALDQLSQNANITLGVVGGSDREKQLEQLDGAEHLFRYLFSENGLVYYENGALKSSTSLLEKVGEEAYQDLVNFTLKELASIVLPAKRGNFIELRTGLVNICPVGRSVTQKERDAFVEHDKRFSVRARLADALKTRFGHLYTFSLGGQISIDAFPHGWDKTYCLKHVDESYDEIHFFGDQTQKGGNDYELFHHPSVIGHTVQNPKHTIEILREEMKIL